MNHLCEMNFLVVVSVPFTTKSWLLLKGELCKDADACTKCLTLPKVSGSLGPCISPSLREPDCGTGFSRQDAGRGRFSVDFLLLFPELELQVTNQWQPLDHEVSIVLRHPYKSLNYYFAILVCHLVRPRKCC